MKKKMFLLAVVCFSFLMQHIYAQTAAQKKDQFYWDSINVASKEPYRLGEDSKKQNGVPEGTITKYHWTSNKIYPGTQRDYWLYVPKQYDQSKPACLMIFQDGESYLYGKEVNANIVFDNLINKGEIPVIIGLFVNPGDKGPGNPVYGGTDNRSFEYDTVSDLYARFLIEELIPEVKKKIYDYWWSCRKGDLRNQFRWYLCV